MKIWIFKFMADALLYALGLFSLAMIVMGWRGIGMEHGWAFVALGIVGLAILGLMIWGRRVLLAMERREGKL